MAREEYRITARTPIHIGSGEKFSSIDSLPRDDRYFIINIEEVLDKLKDNPKALDEFGGRNFNIGDFLRDYGINPDNVKKYMLGNPQRLLAWNINEMVKTGFDKPLIPGTSLKGALRTVIFWHLLKDSPPKEVENILDNILSNANPNKPGEADNELGRYLFGKNPNYDFFRSLQAGDVEFEISDIELMDTKVLSVDDRGGFGWKKMGRGGFNSSDPSQATSIYCEAISVDATAIGKIKIDKYLLENSTADKELSFSDRKVHLTNLAKNCNNFSQDFISKEIDFFKNCGMHEMVRFYTNLQEEIPQDNDSFFLHLGWGSGWRSMSGNYLDSNFLRRFRGKYRLGKSTRDRATGKWSQFPVFPKTRKIVFVNGKPKYPLGWMKLERIE